MIGELDRLEQTGKQRIEDAKDNQSLERVRVELLGRKGELTTILRGLGRLPGEQRAGVGARANHLKELLESAIRERAHRLESAALSELDQQEWLDMTFLPGQLLRGHLHPITLILREMRAVFSRIGYRVALGPEVEDDFLNFEALNIGPGHPARDTMDSFYVGDGEFLLRTHTSPVQIRYMREHPPPIRIVAPGRVYRRDYDATHLPEFHQLEGLCVDEDIRLSDLKGTIEYFCRSMFGPDRRIRIVGDHFPFTEPSVGAAVSCGICAGKGCRSCKGGWLEIMGAGMVHPQVLRNGNVDPEKYSGFAFGMGIDRIAMLKYNIADLRTFFENDLRFLHQF
jgi:phenylalanyl-tRNA synthetase alpha chain